MTELQEGRLVFTFPDDWQAIKYDDTHWHRHRLKSRLKGMDILAHCHGDTHWWIEIKDCEGYEPENRPRLSAKDSRQVVESRQWVKEQEWQSVVKVKRKKPFIVDEVEEKVLDTLASITIAQREANPELQDFTTAQNPPPMLRVVLLLTWNQRDFRRLAIRLQERLNRTLSLYDMRAFVVNEHNTEDAGLHCQVARRQV